VQNPQLPRPDAVLDFSAVRSSQEIDMMLAEEFGSHFASVARTLIPFDELTGLQQPRLVPDLC
jgi:hypothetical protein